jgi:hypothetical protein
MFHSRGELSSIQMNSGTFELFLLKETLKCVCHLTDLEQTHEGVSKATHECCTKSSFALKSEHKLHLTAHKHITGLLLK